ncbi:oxidoreductase [Chryseobacterium lathyri]|uniref:NAD(P)-dependent dehydrogenase (Short-subunit alcohol dehydrogenase family) n=1 Tax=Chryseobacterium lathyri TaxID=395933 RepID=A0ABT9SMX8_9FLAO|nr:oxidoreductase [Chryseobacterium lathyri]MDP9960757.1 NAD(P)-dependent dehydrogenase (short-subunit alcohol dehydrogenase family) [Chryseobacterium lathyri]
MTTKSWTADDIPSQQGKTILITGANSGLGLEASKVLSSKGAHVIMTARNLKSGNEAISLIKKKNANAKLDLMHLDLSDFASIHQFSQEFHNKYRQLDVLINNAGVMFPAKRELTKQNFEIQFGMNHLGHFLLTGLLLDVLKSTPNSRIAIQSSGQHKAKMGKPDIYFDDLNFDKGYNKYVAYTQSKLANLLFAYELDRQLKSNNIDITVVSAHPGYTKTNLVRHSGFFVQSIITNILAQSVEMGTLPILRAATDINAVSGEYFGPTKMNEMRGYPEVVRSSDKSYDKDLAGKLWKVSEKLTQIIYNFT